MTAPVVDADVRERLEARGLLRRRQGLDDAVSHEPAGQPRDRRGQGRVRRIRDDAATRRSAVADERDEGGAIGIACPACRTRRRVTLDATRFDCDGCERSWRWARCRACRTLAITFERQRSWACPACRWHTRAWWDGPSARFEQERIVRHRQDLARGRAEARLRLRRQLRRAKTAASGAVAAAVIAFAAVTSVATAPPSSAEAASQACAAFSRLRDRVATGSLTPTEVARGVTEVVQAAQDGTPALQAAADQLFRAAPRPGSELWLQAQTAVADACRHS